MPEIVIKSSKTDLVKERFFQAMLTLCSMLPKKPYHRNHYVHIMHSQDYDGAKLSHVYMCDGKVAIKITPPNFLDKGVYKPIVNKNSIKLIPISNEDTLENYHISLFDRQWEVVQSETPLQVDTSHSISVSFLRIYQLTGRLFDISVFCRIAETKGIDLLSLATNPEMKFIKLMGSNFQVILVPCLVEENYV